MNGLGNSSSPEQELGDPKEKCILIVDDDESIQSLLQMMVKKEGFQVETAFDGKEAVRKVVARSPDLILLDVMMPVMGGLEALKAFQAEDAGVRVIVITGRQLDRTMVEILRQESNVVDFMTKPIKPAVLAGILHRLLKTRPPDMDRSTHSPWR